jgi:hypothetical protein
LHWAITFHRIQKKAISLMPALRMPHCVLKDSLQSRSQVPLSRRNIAVPGQDMNTAEINVPKGRAQVR